MMKRATWPNDALSPLKATDKSYLNLKCQIAETQRYCQVKVRVIYWVHESVHTRLFPPSVPCRDYQPLCLAVLPLLPQLPRYLGDDGQARGRTHLRNRPRMVLEVR